MGSRLIQSEFQGVTADIECRYILKLVSLLQPFLRESRQATNSEKAGEGHRRAERIMFRKYRGQPCIRETRFVDKISAAPGVAQGMILCECAAVGSPLFAESEVTA